MAVAPIFAFYNKQKKRGLTKDDDHFKKVDADKAAFFSKNNPFLENFLKSKNFEQSQIVEMLRDISILFVAQERGYLDADWNRMFNITKPDSFIKIIRGRYEELKKSHPEILEEWDKNMEELYKKQSTRPEKIQEN